MGTLDHQIKLTTAQVILLYYSLLQFANLIFSNMKFLLFVVAMVAAASALEAEQEAVDVPDFFTGTLKTQQVAIDAIAAADAKLGKIELKLAAFADAPATKALADAVAAYEAVVDTSLYGPGDSPKSGFAA